MDEEIFASLKSKESPPTACESREVTRKLNRCWYLRTGNDDKLLPIAERSHHRTLAVAVSQRCTTEIVIIPHCSRPSPPTRTACLLGKSFSKCPRHQSQQYQQWHQFVFELNPVVVVFVVKPYRQELNFSRRKPDYFTPIGNKAPPAARDSSEAARALS